MRFEHTQVMNFEGALRGMRNPLNSWAKSDSHISWEYGKIPEYVIGPNDMDLCRRLINGGSEHRKFLRQIMVSVDITAPLFWWKEFDTYKVGTTANSTSTMHKLASTPITLDCFETDDYEPDLIVGIWAMGESEEPDYSAPIKIGEITEVDTDNNTSSTQEIYNTYNQEDFNIQPYIENIINFCERLRKKYLETKDKRYWKELIRWLPNGWLQTRTVTMNYENLRSMAHQRMGHKLSEWHSFLEWANTLPYAKELIFD